MSGREYAKLKRMLGCQNVQDTVLLAGQTCIYIPLRIEPLGKNRGHRTLRRTGIGRTSSVRCTRSCHLSRAFKVQWSFHRAPDASDAQHSESDAKHPMHSSKQLETIFDHQTRLTVGQRTPLPCKLGRRERGSQTHLYCSNFTFFVNVLTPPSVLHHVHVC
jgi:hypothetical protein